MERCYLRRVAQSLIAVDVDQRVQLVALISVKNAQRKADGKP